MGSERGMTLFFLCWLASVSGIAAWRLIATDDDPLRVGLSWLIATVFIGGLAGLWAAVRRVRS